MRKQVSTFLCTAISLTSALGLSTLEPASGTIVAQTEMRTKAHPGEPSPHTVRIASLDASLIWAATRSNPDFQTQTGDPTFELKVLTFNLYLLPLDAPSISLRAEMLSRAPFVRGFDVILFQELFDNKVADRFLKNMKQWYPYQSPIGARLGTRISSDCNSNDCWNLSDTTSTGAPNLFQDSGVAIVSKWPIETRIYQTFIENCGWTDWAARGFAYVVIKWRDRNVHLVSAHLAPQDKACVVENDKTTRAKQLRQIRTFLKSRRIPKSDVVIVGGDMNIHSGSAEYDRMIEILKAVPPINSGHLFTYDEIENPLANHSAKIENARKRYDYVFLLQEHAGPRNWVNHAIRRRIIPFMPDYSDHYPVLGYHSGTTYTPPSDNVP